MVNQVPTVSVADFHITQTALCIRAASERLFCDLWQLATGHRAKHWHSGANVSFALGLMSALWVVNPLSAPPQSVLQPTV
ncbi:MAG: hypothetical protein OXE78_01575 [Gammaproteobacteria bacterium]|nr:hypothetical protein [Gammaproteobacteria bacterium]MCY4357833.1 hypothetical protein [Gammaproteobacteria bacterium]